MKRPLTYFLIAVCALLILPGTSWAKTITLDDVLSLATKNNPALQAALHEANAAHARPPQAATPPDPNFMVQFGQVPINTIDVSQGTTTYMVQQEIPFPSKLVYGYKAEKRTAFAKDSQHLAVSQEVVRRVKLAYLDIYLLQEESRIEHATLAAYRANKSAAETAYASDKGDLADPVRASVDMGDIEAHLATIEQQRLAAIATLSALISDSLDPSTKVAKPKSLPKTANLSTLVERAKEARPEISQAEHMIDASAANVGLAKSQYAPDLTLRWGYDDRPNMQNAWTGRVMVSVPLWSLSKQRFGVREAKAMEMRTKAMKEESVNRTTDDVKSAYAFLEAARKRRSVYGGKVVPRARTLRDAAREAYANGNGDFLGVVDSIRSWRSAELELVRARVDEHRAHAQLERAVGASPTEEAL